MTAQFVGVERLHEIIGSSAFHGVNRGFHRPVSRDHHHQGVRAVRLNAVEDFEAAHIWARIEHGAFVRLGIDDFALRLLGSPTGISLPKIGTRLKRGESGWSIRREEHYASVLSPMAGTVKSTNQSASKQPGLSKKDPYGEGWLIVVDPQGGLRKQTKHLLFEKRAVAWLDAEAKKLEEMVMSVYGSPVAATGGENVEDILGNLSHLRWDDLVREFLRT